MPEQGVPLSNPATRRVDGHVSVAEGGEGEIELRAEVFSGLGSGAVVLSLTPVQAWELAGALKDLARKVRERPQEPSSGDLVVDASGTLAFRPQGCVSREVS